MIIEQLDLETRSKIYSYTKKVLRKYQKGITTGKMTADKFADNILSNGEIDDLLDKDTLQQDDFKKSYISYIETLMDIQNTNLSNGKKKRAFIKPEKPSVTDKLKLKNLLATSGYSLSIPIEYLNSLDVESLIKFLSTGSIDLGNERIYNYVHKTVSN